MFIHSKQALEIVEGNKKYLIPAGYVGEVPGWVSKHWFFKAAQSDGTISTPKSKKDSEIEKAAEPEVDSEAK